MANGSSYSQAVLTEEDLQCPICFEEYQHLKSQRLRHPKLLLCIHTFCYECIQTLRQPNGKIQCAICRKEHEMPDLSDVMDNYVVFDYLVRKQLLDDEQFANLLSEEINEHNVGEAEEEQPMSTAPVAEVPADVIVIKPLPEPYIVEDEHIVVTSDEESDPQIVENIVLDDETGTNGNFFDVIDDGLEGNLLQVLFSSADGHSATANYDGDDESERSYGSPAVECLVSDNESHDSQPEVFAEACSSNSSEEGQSNRKRRRICIRTSGGGDEDAESEEEDECEEEDGCEEEDDAVEDEEDDEEEEEDSNTFATEPSDSGKQRLGGDHHEDSWEDIECEEEDNFEVRRLRILEQKLRNNFFLTPQPGEACTFQ